MPPLTGAEVKLETERQSLVQLNSRHSPTWNHPKVLKVSRTRNDWETLDAGDRIIVLAEDLLGRVERGISREEFPLWSKSPTETTHPTAPAGTV
jgi:hypothetical protein